MPHHITIPVFDNTPGNLEALYFKCGTCEATVKAVLSHQPDIARGEVGHKCTDCGQHYAIVTATCCNKPFIVDDLEWEELSSGNTLDCPNCGEATSLPPRSDFQLQTMYRTSPILVPLTTHQSESDFVKAAKHTLSTEQQERLAAHHQSSISRLQLSKSIAQEIQEMEIIPSLKACNNKDLISETGDDATSEQAVLDKIFLLSNSLVSVLDLVAQEINITLNLGLPEERVSFKTVVNKTNSFNGWPNTLQSEVSADMINYLTSLRNVCQHRRIPIQATDTKITVPGYSPLRPAALKMSPTIFLPDNPLAASSETTFQKRIEVKRRCRDLTATVESMVLTIYSHLS